MGGSAFACLVRLSSCPCRSLPSLSRFCRLRRVTVGSLLSTQRRCSSLCTHSTATPTGRLSHTQGETTRAVRSRSTDWSEHTNTRRRTDLCPARAPTRFCEWSPAPVPPPPAALPTTSHAAARRNSMNRIRNTAILLVALIHAVTVAIAQDSFSYVLYTGGDHSSFQLYDGVSTAAGFDSTGRTPLWDGSIDLAGAGAEGLATPNPALPVSMGDTAMRFPGAPALFTSLPATQAAIQSAAVGTGTANDLKSDDLFLLSTASAPQVWTVLPIAQRPQSTFLSSELSCDTGSAGPLYFSDRVMQCWDVAAASKDSSTFVLNFTTSVSRSAASAQSIFPLSMGVSFGASSGVASATMRSQALIMLLHRTLTQLYSAREITAAVHINTRRRNRARVAVGFLWTFGGLVAVFLALMAATFQSWLLPLFPYPYALFVWIALLLGLGVLLSIFVGILGFLGFVIVLAFYSVVVGIGYYCQRLASRETPPTALESEQRALLQKQRKEEAKRREMAVLSPNSNSKSPSGSGSPPSAAAASAGAAGATTNAASSPPPSYGAAGNSGDAAAADPAPIEYSFLPYSRAPHRMGYVQRRLLGFTAMFALSFLVLCVALFGIWRVDDYRVVHSMSRALPLAPTVVEYIPQNIAKGVMSIYAFDGLSTKLNLNEMFFAMSTGQSKRELRVRKRGSDSACRMCLTLPLCCRMSRLVRCALQHVLVHSRHALPRYLPRLHLEVLGGHVSIRAVRLRQFLNGQ